MIAITNKVGKDTLWFILKFASAISAIFGALKTVKDFADGEGDWWHIPLVLFIVAVFFWCIYVLLVRSSKQSRLIPAIGQTPAIIYEWRYSKKERFAAMVCAVLIFVCGFGGYVYFLNTLTFKKGEYGIIILRIGDDKEDSMATRFRNAINSQLSHESPSFGIKVHFLNKKIDESSGNSEAHEQARKIGKKYHAQLVVWGDATDGKRFDPRITVVNELVSAGLINQFSITSQDISGIELNPSLVEQPISLAHFVIAYSFFTRQQYQDALRYFDMGMNFQNNYTLLKPDFLYFKGRCHFLLAKNNLNVTANLNSALAEFEEASKLYASNNLDNYLIRSFASLGDVYLLLQTNNRADNLRHAIFFYESILPVLEVYPSKLAWAGIQNNLSLAYSGGLGSQPIDLNKAIEAANSALTVYDPMNYPDEWAMIQGRLCIEYSMLGNENGGNLQKSIESGEAAIRSEYKKGDVNDWAVIQGTLCTDYRFIRIGNHTENLKKSAEAGEMALCVFNETNNAPAWASVKGSLCADYADLIAVNTKLYPQKAIASGEAALHFFSISNCPSIWAEIQIHLADAYISLQATNHIENIQRSIRAFESALLFYTKSNNPDQWALIQGSLCSAHGMIIEQMIPRVGPKDMPDIIQHAENLITNGEAALQILTKNNHFDQWLGVQYNLSMAYGYRAFQNHKDNLLHAKECAENVVNNCSQTNHPQYYESDLKLLKYVNDQLLLLP